MKAIVRCKDNFGNNKTESWKLASKLNDELKEEFFWLNVNDWYLAPKYFKSEKSAVEDFFKTYSDIKSLQKLIFDFEFKED